MIGFAMHGRIINHFHIEITSWRLQGSGQRDSVS